MSYVASEVEKEIVSGKAEQYVLAALVYLDPGYTDATNLSQEVGNKDIIDMIPADRPISLLRQNINGKMMWTVTLTHVPGQLVSTTNSQSGRSRSRKHAVMAALIRCLVQTRYQVAVPLNPEPPMAA